MDGKNAEGQGQRADGRRRYCPKCARERHAAGQAAYRRRQREGIPPLVRVGPALSEVARKMKVSVSTVVRLQKSALAKLRKCRGLLQIGHMPTIGDVLEEAEDELSAWQALGREMESDGCSVYGSKVVREVERLERKMGRWRRKADAEGRLRQRNQEARKK